MKMKDRRTTLKQLGLIASGVLILPSCDFLNPRKVSVALANLSITVEQEDLVKLLVDTMIPKDEFKGAKELGVDKFVWIMVDDCLEEKQQDIFLVGLRSFEQYFEKTKLKKFSKVESKERIEFLLNTMELKASEPPPLPIKEPKEPDDIQPPVESYLKYIQQFINMVKYFAIQGYLQSEYIMRKVMPYALVPGKIEYCKIIDPSKRINING